jgi:glutamyl-tRNA synthetase
METESSVRVRFAPSPTGYLHVGGARTALFNWLFARSHGGVFVLRIEDTDRERSSDAMTQAILHGMTWLGLDWDEGPLHQADGMQRHREDVRTLLGNGRAYRCFCTPEQLDAKRSSHPDGPAGYRYDRSCLAVPAAESAHRAAGGEPHTVRFHVPPGSTRWEDGVHGMVEFANADIDDFIVLRTDGTPIYNMAVVSDDVAMRITHVIRGDDHISNTPKQILLYQALGIPAPVFVHVPMILGPDGRRLSKRHGATAMGEYEQHGILPEAMFNFLALLGWSPGTDQEIFSRDELARQFTLEGINRKSAIFDTQKLEWMNGRYLAATPARELAGVLRELCADAVPRPAEWWEQLAELLKVRARTIREMAEMARPYVGQQLSYDEAAVARHWKDPAAVAEVLSRIADLWAALPEFDEAAMESTLRELAGQLGMGAGKLIHPLRVALTGVAASPGIFEVARLLGRGEVLRRLQLAVTKLRDTLPSDRESA